VHIFSIGAACNVSPPAYSDGRGASLPANARSNLSFLKKVIPGVASSYLESEWSFAQLRGLDGPAVCGFGAQPNTIVVVGGDGSFLTAGFGGGGDCGRISFAKFVRGEAEEADEVRLSGAVCNSEMGPLATRFMLHFQPRSEAAPKGEAATLFTGPVHRAFLRPSICLSSPLALALVFAARIGPLGRPRIRLDEAARMTMDPFSWRRRRGRGAVLSSVHSSA